MGDIAPGALHALDDPPLPVLVCRGGVGLHRLRHRVPSAGSRRLDSDSVATSAISIAPTNRVDVNDLHRAWGE